MKHQSKLFKKNNNELVSNGEWTRARIFICIVNII